MAVIVEVRRRKDEPFDKFLARFRRALEKSLSRKEQAKIMVHYGQDPKFLPKKKAQRPAPKAQPP